MGITRSREGDAWPEMQPHGPGYVDLYLPGRTGEVGPVRITRAVRRQNRQGPGFRAPARELARYMDRMRELDPVRRVPEGALQTFRERWGRKPALAMLGLGGMTYESMRTPILTFLLEE